jgi:AAA domain
VTGFDQFDFQHGLAQELHRRAGRLAGRRAKELDDLAVLVHTEDDPDKLVRWTADAAEVSRNGATRRRELQADDGFEPEAVNWPELIADGIPEPAFLSKPYVPERARIWTPGPAESGKSIWWLATAAELTRRGLVAVVIDQENPLDVVLRRIVGLEPAIGRLHLYHDAGLDLAQAEHREWLIGRTAELGARLVVLDTLTGCWSGNENDNAEIAEFDREVLLPLRAAGASTAVLDHTGHPQAFVRRDAAHAGRGASAKGQKADVVLEFKPDGEHSFAIKHGKNRPGGGRREPERTIEVVDSDDGRLKLVATEGPAERAARELAETMVGVICGAAQPLSTKQLRTVAGGTREVQDDAIELLKTEDPRRVDVKDETIETDGGPQRGKWWRPVQEKLG